MKSFGNFLEMVRYRESVRAYKADPVPRESIERCLEAARLAPSACNAQPWKFIVVDDPELKNAVAEATQDRIIPMNHFTRQAPVHVVVVREKANLTSGIGQVLKNKEYPLIDIGIAVEHFCLQAVEEGLGTCILGWFKEKQVKKLLGILPNKRRKTFADIAVYNKYA